MKTIENQVRIHDVASDNEPAGYRLVEFVNERKNTNHEEVINNLCYEKVYRSVGVVLDEELEKTRDLYESLCGHPFFSNELP